jgi:dUTP pyrophosphatase
VRRVVRSRYRCPPTRRPGRRADLCAASRETATLAPGERRLIPTGIAWPYRRDTRPDPAALGLGARAGIGIVNSPGTIDADFRGEIGIVLINHGQQPFAIELRGSHSS